MGSALGAMKTAARRLGVPFHEYVERVSDGQKWCGRCLAWHPRAEFGSDRSRSDGLNSVCVNSRVVATTSPGVRERRIKASAGLAWCRRCLIWLPVARVTQGACRPHLNEAYRAQYAKNPGDIRARVRARSRGLAPIPAWWREERFEEFGNLCAYGCNRPAGALDHVWPVARGGESRPSNLVPACIHCNSSKSDSDPLPWLRRFAAAFPFEYVDFMEINYLHGGPFDLGVEDLDDGRTWDQYPGTLVGA